MIEEKVAALEAKVAELEARLNDYKLCIEDNNENIRSFSQRINEYGARAEKAAREAVEYEAAGTREAVESGLKVLVEVRDKARGEIVEAVAEEVVKTIGDGSHGMVRVAGQPNPVLKRL